MNQFLEKHKLSKLNQKEIGNIDIFYLNKNELIVKNLPKVNLQQ